MAVLQCDGFLTIEAENGVHALDLLNKLDGAVDLLVSDIKMPVMDGITLARSVLAEFPSIPVILVSGYADIAQAKLPNSGFEFVQLPFHPDTLAECREEGDDAQGNCILRMNRNGKPLWHCRQEPPFSDLKAAAAANREAGGHSPTLHPHRPASLRPEPATRIGAF